MRHSSIDPLLLNVVVSYESYKNISSFSKEVGLQVVTFFTAI